MRTITKSAFGAPGRSGISAAALVTLASAIAALVVMALSATAAQSAERHNGDTIALSGGKTWLKIDKGTAAALSDAVCQVLCVNTELCANAGGEVRGDLEDGVFVA